MKISHKMLIAENKVKIYNNEKIDGESLKMEIGLFKKFPNTSHLEIVSVFKIESPWIYILFLKIKDPLNNYKYSPNMEGGYQKRLEKPIKMVAS